MIGRQILDRFEWYYIIKSGPNKAYLFMRNVQNRSVAIFSIKSDFFSGFGISATIAHTNIILLPNS